jgi:hypothetical protein
MASILNKMLDFVGWETEVVDEDIYEDEELEEPGKNDYHGVKGKKSQGKVLNLNMFIHKAALKVRGVWRPYRRIGRKFYR